MDLGDFEFESTSALLGDPAYDDGSDLLVRVGNVARGDWSAWYTKVQLQGERSAEVVAVRKGSKIAGWRVIGTVGVDSGQAGIFDRAHFEARSVVTGLASTTPFGVVSSSGLGDGLYSAFAADGPAGVVALRLVFLKPDSKE